MSGPPLLQARDLVIRHPRRGWFASPAERPALDGVNLRLETGQRLAIVGESGSGKSTLLRALLRLVVPAAGQVLIAGEDLAILSKPELRAARRRLQMVFQDPLASLNPAWRVGQIVAEPLREQGLSTRDGTQRVVEHLESVGLGREFLDRRPAQLSGGQAQRVAIARALIARPQALLCDEPVSALDMSLRAQVLQLLDEQCRARGIALLFVTHDLAAARMLCPRTLVLQRGVVVEQADTAALFAAPGHPYTRMLLDARLTLDGKGGSASKV